MSVGKRKPMAAVLCCSQLHRPSEAKVAEEEALARRLASVTTLSSSSSSCASSSSSLPSSRTFLFLTVSALLLPALTIGTEEKFAVLVGLDLESAMLTLLPLPLVATSPEPPSAAVIAPLNNSIL